MWRTAGCHILHSCQQILFVIVPLMAPADPREERFQGLERVEQLKDSENVPVHLFTDVYEASTMCQEYDPGAGAQLSRAVLI